MRSPGLGIENEQSPERAIERIVMFRFSLAPTGADVDCNKIPRASEAQPGATFLPPPGLSGGLPG